MNVYYYNEETFEYITYAQAELDPMATYREHKEVYLKPLNATFIEPPRVEIGKVATFNVEKNKWEIKNDHRGTIVYNIATRQPKVWDKIGEIPAEYVLKLTPTLAETKTKFLETVSISFYKCTNKTKVEIPNTDLAFTYAGLEGLIKERDLGLVASRDDNDKVYAGLTTEQYNDIIEYLKVYGQLAYLAKWELESAITKCQDLDILNTYKDKLEIKVDPKKVKALVKMSEEKRNEYFIKNAQNIK